MPRILGLLPARGGSKRIPGKNIRLLGGKPLLAWTIDLCKCIPEIDKTLISTDDPSIAEIARALGGWVPWLRPAELAKDTTKSAEVAIHALDWYENRFGMIDGLLLLQPTSPFRKTATVKRGIELFFAFNQRPVVGVSRSKTPPEWCFRLDGMKMQAIHPGHLSRRSQDMPDTFCLNGSFFLVSPSWLRNEKSFYSEDMVPLVSDTIGESIDIDDESDWMLAEAFGKNENNVRDR